MTSIFKPEEQHHNPALSAQAFMERSSGFIEEFTKKTVEEISSPRLKSNVKSLPIYVSKEFEDALNQGVAGAQIRIEDEANPPFLVLGVFAGRLNLNFKSGNSAFILEKCQNFNMDAMLYSRSFVQIGRMSSCNYCSATILDASVIIGEDCMLSHGIVIQPSDQHDIVDLETGQSINRKRSVVLGKHVWAGREAYIGAGAMIGDNSVIGARAVTTSVVPANSVVAGNPARVIKSGIAWKRSFTTSEV